MSETSLEQWKRIRASGKQRFIWMHGLLFWTLTVGAMVYILLSEMQIFSLTQCLIAAGVGMVAVALIGYWYGNSIWRQNEQVYRQLIRVEKDPLDEEDTVRILPKKVPAAADNEGFPEQDNSRGSVRVPQQTLNDYISNYEQQTAAQLLHNMSNGH